MYICGVETFPIRDGAPLKRPSGCSQIAFVVSAFSPMATEESKERPFPIHFSHGQIDRGAPIDTARLSRRSHGKRGGGKSINQRLLPLGGV